MSLAVWPECKDFFSGSTGDGWGEVVDFLAGWNFSRASGEKGGSVQFTDRLIVPVRAEPHCRWYIILREQDRSWWGGC